MPHIFSLFLDLLLYPSRLITDQRAPVRWLLVLSAEVLVVLGGALLLLGMFLPLGLVALVVGPLLGLVLTMVAALPLFFSLPYQIPTFDRITLSSARALMVVGVPATLGFTLAFSTAFPALQHDFGVVLLFLLAMGFWSAGALTVALLLSSGRAEATGLRWFAAAAALLLAGLLWWSPPLRQSEAVFFAPMLLGLALGLLRPLSYLWEAPLSLALALAARLGAPAQRLLAAHPVSLDELCLVPLPGLATLLAKACEEEIASGGPWLISVAAHPSQAGAARRALEALVRGERAHPVLFWLSTHEEGAAWLRRLTEGLRRPHPLIAAYAALAAVGEPAAWPTAVAAHRHALTAAAGHPGGAAVQALVEAGAQTIAADRWPAAMDALRCAPQPSGVAPDPLWEALESVRAWSDQQPALLHDRAQALATLWDSLDDLEGWPVKLLDAMAEHLVYLLIVEHRRGVWLV